MKKKQTLIALTALGLGLLLIIELRPWQDLSKQAEVSLASDPAKTAEGKDSKPPEPATVRLDSDSQAIRAQLSPVTYTKIAAELNARVQELPRREGENFSRSDVLAVFECSAQRAQLERSTAARGIAERNFTTNQKLIELGAVGQVELDNSRSEFEKAQAEVNEFSAVVRRCTIFAPFSGRVVEQHVRSQQFVQTGQPVLDILDNRALELEFIAPSRWSPWLVQGYAFKISVDETGKSYPARVTRVGAKIDSVSQTFKVAAVINGSYSDLSPGMSGTLEIQPPALTN
jgi:membrane fusion protein, multidrug efflux system